MSANIQYNITYSDVGAIFNTIVISDRREIDFILETAESKFTMTVDLSDLLDNVLSELDFDDIAGARVDELQPEYSTEQIANYDEFNGDYSAYATYIGEKVLSDMSEYAIELEDLPVRVETWI